MAAENIDRTTDGTGPFPAKVPGLSDSADIQAALRLYHYGSYNYDATAETPATLPSASIAGHLHKLKTGNISFLYATLANFPDPVINHGYIAHAHSTGKLYFAHAGEWIPLTDEDHVQSEITNAIGGATGGYPQLAGNGIDWNSVNLRFDIEPAILNSSTVITKTSGFTLAAEDVSKTILLSTPDSMTLTIPTNSSVTIPVGYQYNFVEIGTGRTTFAPSSGVTIGSKNDQLFLDGRYSKGTLVKTATNEWILFGDVYEGVATPTAPTPTPVASPTPAPVAPTPIVVPVAPTPIVVPVAPTPIVVPVAPTPIVVPVAPTPTGVLVPNVVGDQSDSATSELQSAGFTVGYAFRTEGATAQNAGYVYSQSPAAGTLALQGSLVTMTVYSYSLNLATPSLSVAMGPGGSGTVYANVTVGNLDYANSYSSNMGSQNPEHPQEWNISGLTSGQSYTVQITASRSGHISSTGSITFTASSGVAPTPVVTPVAPTPIVTPTAPANCTMPPVVGRTLSEASGLIVASGWLFEYLSETSIGATAQNDGTVASQDPAPGTTSTCGLNAGITLYVYTAPSPVAPTPVAPTPVAPTPVAPTPVAPTPTPTAGTWYCTSNESEGVYNFTMNSDGSGSECNSYAIVCSQSGYPPTPNIPACAPTPVAPTPVAPTPVAPTPVAPTPTPTAGCTPNGSYTYVYPCAGCSYVCYGTSLCCSCEYDSCGTYTACDC